MFHLQSLFTLRQRGGRRLRVGDILGTERPGPYSPAPRARCHHAGGTCGTVVSSVPKHALDGSPSGFMAQAHGGECGWVDCVYVLDVISIMSCHFPFLDPSRLVS